MSNQMKIRNDEASREMMEAIREHGMEWAEDRMDLSEIVTGQGATFTDADYEDAEGEEEGAADARHEAKCERIREFIISQL